jgi:RNA polymerase sigma-70 factor (ECF subfamily)
MSALAALDDRDLVARILRRDENGERCAEELVLRHEGRLKRWLRHWTGSSEDAADLRQDTWVVAFRVLRRWRPEKCRFPSWLHGIAHHLAQHWWRHRDRTAEAEQSHPCCCLDAFLEPEEAYEQKQAHEELQRVLALLASTERACLVLHWVEQRSWREVGLLLGVTEGHARLIGHRAEVRLRAVLGHRR